MKKAVFLSTLRERLIGLPPKKIDEYCAFYEKKIDARIKSVFEEERAVSEVGNFRSIAEYAFIHTSLFRLFIENKRPKKKQEPWQIVLRTLGLILLSPVILLKALFLLLLWLLLWLPAVLSLGATVGCFGAAGVSALAAVRHFQAGNVTQAIFFSAGIAVLVGFGVLCLLMTISVFRICVRYHVKALHGLKKKYIRKVKFKQVTLIRKEKPVVDPPTPVENGERAEETSAEAAASEEQPAENPAEPLEGAEEAKGPVEAPDGEAPVQPETPEPDEAPAELSEAPQEEQKEEQT